MADFATLINRMTDAAVRGCGAEVAACFTETGQYHDCFYGTFIGAEIVELIEQRFHRDANNFLWQVIEPVQQQQLGYARYLFSYDSLLSEAAGRRAMFEGVSICRIDNGLIADYKEVANVATGLSLLGFDAQRMHKFADKEAKHLLNREESREHIVKT